jgi:hypothetical protein
MHRTEEWDARGERSDLESGDTQPADARNLQRRSTNIKSERGSGEIDLKTFYLPVRNTEIAPSDAVLPLPQAISAAEIFWSKLKGLALVCLPLVSALQDLGYHPQLFRVPPDAHLPRVGHDLCTFQMQNTDPLKPRLKVTNATVKIRASTILGEFEQAQFELVLERPERSRTFGLTKCMA